MKTTEPKIILDTDPEAATQVTVTGWRSRDGFFFGDNESAARYAGCTHRACETCGTPTEKMYLKCRACREKADVEKYAALPREAWDGVSMIYSDAEDRYFNDWEEVLDYCADEPFEPEDLRLLLCEGNKPRHIDPDDYCCDELAEDGEVEDADFIAACKALNAAIDKMRPLSWSPRHPKVAMKLPEPARDPFDRECEERDRAEADMQAQRGSFYP